MMITSLFIVIIALCFVLGLMFPKHRIPYSNAATTLGVLGTFIGICYGLSGFDVDDIQGSIPILLEGLKTAFFTSIAGMVAALTLRMLNNFSKKDETTDDSVELQRQLLKEQVEMMAVFKSIQRGICGEDTDSSLLNQLKLMRTTLTDEIKTLNVSFKEFTARQAQDNTAAIMEALQKVLTEFKMAIEQNLSESFKEFSEACKALHVWQQEHKDEISAMHDALDDTISIMQANGDLLSDLSEEQEHFSDVNRQLNAQLQQLENHANLLKTLSSSWPQLMNGLQQQVTDMSAKIMSAASQSAFNIEQASNTIENRTISVVNGSTERIEQIISDTEAKFRERFENLVNGLFTPLASIVDKVTSDYTKINETINRLNENNNRL